MDLLTLDMVARSDADGLRRAIESARPVVDRVVVGVDGRSDAETLVVAQALADDVWRFDAAALGLSAEKWAADKIDFAAARNLGRARVKTPWTIVVDTDEFLWISGDVREFIRSLPATVGGVGITVQLDGTTSIDYQRIARTEFRWWSHTHNQLDIVGEYAFCPHGSVVQQLDLRAATEQARRQKQRDAAVEDLKVEANNGDMWALFHVAKHVAHAGAEDMIEWVNKFRLSAEVHGPAAMERIKLAIITASKFFDREDWANANLWAVHALMDGPNLEAFCLLGDIAELQGRMEHALAWYEIACVTPPSQDFSIPELLTKRFLRRDELRGDKQAAEAVEHASVRAKMRIR